MYDCVATAKAATKSQLSAVGWVVTKRTIVLAFAGSYFVSTRLSVTRVAIVRVSVTKPKSYRAAKLALKVDVVSSVFFTILDSCADPDCRTLWTNKFLRFKFFQLILLLPFDFTVFHPPKIRSFAFETLIVSALEKSELLKFVIKLVAKR